IIAEFTKIECENQNPTIMQTLNCQINKTASNLSSFHMKAVSAEDLTNLDGLYILAIKRGNSYFNHTSIKMNYCEALHKSYREFTIKMVFEGLRHVSNFPVDCPFKKNVPYYINGFTFDPKAIPSYMCIRLSFRMDAKIFFNRKNLFRIRVYGEVKPN
ncbi:GH25133, partial [Drosophila grimshawi]